MVAINFVDLLQESSGFSPRHPSPLFINLALVNTPANEMPSKTPSGHTLRKGRVSLQNQVYLVTFVTEGRKHRFTNLQCGRLMTRALMDSKKARTLAFVVMPDHVHWLMQLTEHASLSQVVQIVKSVSAYRLNSFLGRKGRLWQSGFHDHALRNEEAVIDAARYIVANPLRAGLVASVGDYSHWDAIWL